MLKIYVARESFVAELHAMPIEVIAGDTRLTEDHPFVRRYPRAFVLDEDAGEVERVPNRIHEVDAS